MLKRLRNSFSFSWLFIASFWEMPHFQSMWFQGNCPSSGLALIHRRVMCCVFNPNGANQGLQPSQDFAKPSEIPEGSVHQGNLTSYQIWQLLEPMAPAYPQHNLLKLTLSEAASLPPPETPDSKTPREKFIQKDSQMQEKKPSSN